MIKTREKKKRKNRENSTEGQLINCTLWGLLKTAGPSLVTLPSIISLKGRLLQARWLCPQFYMGMPIKSREEPVKKTETELSSRSYTNCEWYKRLASHFTVHSSSTLAHNWKHSRRQYCLLNAMLLHEKSLKWPQGNVDTWRVTLTPHALFQPLVHVKILVRAPVWPHWEQSSAGRRQTRRELT